MKVGGGWLGKNTPGEVGAPNNVVLKVRSKRAQICLALIQIVVER